MRAFMTSALVCLALGQSAQAQGLSSFSQTGRASSVGFGASQPVVNQPIDTSSAVAPFPGQRTSSSLVNLFRNMKLPGWPSIIGQSNLPGPASFPSTYYPDFQATPFIPANPINRSISR